MGQERPPLAQPATYRDLLRAVSVSRGARPSAPRGVTPATAARWARKTGSDPAAIAWLTDPEA